MIDTEYDHFTVPLSEKHAWTHWTFAQKVLTEKVRRLLSGEEVT